MTSEEEFDSLGESAHLTQASILKTALMISPRLILPWLAKLSADKNKTFHTQQLVIFSLSFLKMKQRSNTLISEF